MGRHSAAPPRRAGTGFRRLRAVLAGGLVLGVGATLTLAAWNDSEFATGSFTAGSFGIEGATNGTTFSEHPATPAVLSFAPLVNAMKPGDVSYTLFSVRTISGSLAGTVKVTAATPGNATGLGQWLQYEVRTIAGTTCNEAAFSGGSSILPLSALTASPSGPQALPANATGQVNYCFRFTLPSGTPNDAQSKTVTATWTFDAQNS